VNLNSGSSFVPSGQGLPISIRLIQMNSKKEDNRDLCAEPDPDDGILPHILAKRSRPKVSVKAGRHRLEQLCKQVRIALGDSLICDCCDPAIQCLEMVSVKPGTGSTVLEVTLKSPSTDPDAIEHAHRQLELASGLLRAAIASAIHRKRVPHLRFHVVASA
jgi:ribosome-binding factor A